MEGEEEAPPSSDVSEEMERLRGEIGKGHITSHAWNPSVSPEALRRVLRGTGAVEREDLRVASGIFDADGAAALFESMPPGSLRVRRLNLFNYGMGDERHIGNAVVESLARELEANATITELELAANCVTDAGMRALARALGANVTLRCLDVGEGGVSMAALVEALEASGTLERLAVRGRSSIEGVRTLLGAVVAHPSLTDLCFPARGLHDFQGPLGADHVREFDKMLRTARSLRRLDLSGSLRDARAFVSVLEHGTSSLTHLDLAMNSLSDSCAKGLARALSSDSCALVSVDVSRCGFGAMGAVALAGVLLVNRTLTWLNLSHNLVGDDGARALFEALKANRTLAVLLLWRCGLKDSTAALAEALEANRTLAVLDLDGNDMRRAGGVAALAAALGRPSCALEALNMYCCSLDKAAGRALADALATNTSLTAFLVQANHRFGNAVTAEIRAATERNRRAREDEDSVQREFLRSAAGRDAVPWIAVDVLSVVSEYTGRAWSAVEAVLHARTGSHFLSEETPFYESVKELW